VIFTPSLDILTSGKIFRRGKKILSARSGSAQHSSAQRDSTSTYATSRCCARKTGAGPTASHPQRCADGSPRPGGTTGRSHVFVQEFSFDTPIPLVTNLKSFPKCRLPLRRIAAHRLASQKLRSNPFTLRPIPVAPVIPPPQAAHEIDLSNEWEDMLAVEPAEADPAQVVPPEIGLRRPSL